MSPAPRTPAIPAGVSIFRENATTDGVPLQDRAKARVAVSGPGDYGSGVSPTRLFTVIGLLGIILAAGLAIAGAWLFALVLLGGIAATGIAITVVNWLAHR